MKNVHAERLCRIRPAWIGVATSTSIVIAFESMRWWLPLVLSPLAWVPLYMPIRISIRLLFCGLGLGAVVVSTGSEETTAVGLVLLSVTAFIAWEVLSHLVLQTRPSDQFDGARSWTAKGIIYSAEAPIRWRERPGWRFVLGAGSLLFIADLFLRWMGYESLVVWVVKLFK